MPNARAVRTPVSPPKPRRKRARGTLLERTFGPESALQQTFGPESALRERLDRLAEHPKGELYLGAGVLGMLSILAIPPRGWTALGGGLFGATAWLIRAPIGAVVIGVLLAKNWSDPDDRVVSTQARVRQD